MTPTADAIYARARAAGMPARSALALARFIAADRIEVPAYGAPVTFERDGFAIRLTVDYDEGMTLADMGYGRFVDGAADWRYPDRERRPEPDAVPNPHRDSRNPSGGAGWYVPAVTLAERAREYHRAGASKSVALELARESLADELARVTWDYGPSAYVLTASASREGIELGSASVGGIEVVWSDVTRTDGSEYLAEVAEDIIPDAIADARASLARLAEYVAAGGTGAGADAVRLVRP